jgi:hypothetical protein
VPLSLTPWLNTGGNLISFSRASEPTFWLICAYLTKVFFHRLSAEMLTYIGCQLIETVRLLGDLRLIKLIIS